MIGCSRGGIVVVVEEILFANIEDGVQIAQGHKAEVGIRIIDLLQKSGDGGSSRIGGDSRRHYDVLHGRGEWKMSQGKFRRSTGSCRFALISNGEEWKQRLIEN